MSPAPRTVIGVVQLIVFLAGCSRGAHSNVGAGGRHTWTTPGVFTFSEYLDPKSLNPILDGAEPTGDLAMFIYSLAVRYDGKAHPVPDALREIPTVANGDVSRDGLTLKYKLRRNIVWQDGPPLTCNDLRFTWQAVMNPHNDVVITDGYKDIRSIDCADPYVAVIHMKRLYAPYLQQLWGVNGGAPILPAHILAKYNDDKGSFNKAPYNALPVGSGPFKVVAWNRGQDVRMVANANFYLGRPKLNEVIYKILPDENTAQAQLQTHEIDMMAGGSGMKWPQYAGLAADPQNGLAAVRADSFAFSFVDFHLTSPIVSDRNVRVALAYATNRQDIVDKLEHGSAILAETDQNPRLSWAYTQQVTHYPYDPDKARAILEADGWKVGPGGVRMKAGRRLAFSLSTATESTNGKLVQAFLQHEWRDVGAEADIKNFPSSQLLENSSSGILSGGHYDVALFSYTNAADPDDSEIYSSENLAPHGQNWPQWKNPVATAAMNDALQTINQPRRKRDYIVVQQQLTHDVPTIIFYFQRVPYVYNSDLRGFDPSPVVSAFWDPWNYSI